MLAELRQKLLEKLFCVNHRSIGAIVYNADFCLIYTMLATLISKELMHGILCTSISHDRHILPLNFDPCANEF